MTLEEVKLYLRVDSTDDDILITEIMNAALIYVDSCVGVNYKDYADAVKLAALVQKKIIADLYDNRVTTVPTTTKQDIIVSTIFEKLSNYEEII